MKRALNCEGVVPQYSLAGRDARPEDASAVRAFLDDNGADHVELVAQGETPVDDTGQARGLVAQWEDAGCDWWIETRWEMPHHSVGRMEEVRTRLAAGPPGHPSG